MPPPHNESLVLASVLPAACAEIDSNDKNALQEVMRFCQRQGVSHQHLEDKQEYIREYLRNQSRHPGSPYDLPRRSRPNSDRPNSLPNNRLSLPTIRSPAYNESIFGQPQLTPNLSFDPHSETENVEMPERALGLQLNNYVAVGQSEVDWSDTSNVRGEETEPRFVNLHSISRNTWYGAKSVQGQSPDSWLRQVIVDEYDLRMEPFTGPGAAPKFNGQRSLGTVILTWSEPKWTKAMRTRFHVTDHPNAADMTIGTTLEEKVRKRRQTADPWESRWYAQNQASYAGSPISPVPIQPQSGGSPLFDRLQTTTSDISALQRLVVISGIVLALSCGVYAYSPRNRLSS